MKQLTALFLTILLAFGGLPLASAQAAETIWMEIDKEAVAVSETITITIKANTAKLVQGFTYQLRYDPNCLQPGVPVSKVSGLNYMAVPQTTGMVEAVFASTTPVSVNDNLSEVKFTAANSCQTSLKLEKASLVIADENGMAANLPGISMGISSLLITITGAAPQPTSASGDEPTTEAKPAIAVTEITPEVRKPDGSLGWLLVPLGMWFGLFIFVGLIVITVQYIRGRRQETQPIKIEPAPAPAESAPTFPALAIKRGPNAGTALPLLTFPCRLGSDPGNDVVLIDPNIAPSHAEILADELGYTLLDLGSGTYLNGRLIKNQQAQLNIGDALRLGGVILVFGPA